MNHFSHPPVDQMTHESSTGQVSLDSEYEALALNDPMITTANWLERSCRRRIVQRFRNISNGQIVVQDAEGEYPLGSIDPANCWCGCLFLIRQCIGARCLAERLVRPNHT